MASYGYTFNSGDGVTPTRLNAARTVSDIVNADINASAAIAATKLASDSITNTQIKSDAAIAGTKIAPNFGSQNVVTTGNLTCGSSLVAEATSGVVSINSRMSTNSVVNAPIVAMDRAGTGGAATPNNVRLGEIRFTGRDTGGVYYAPVMIFAEAGVNTATGAPTALAFATGSATSTERMRIDASGNVGIGTNSPSNKLQLAGETSQFPLALQINATGHATSERAGIGIGDYQWLQDTSGNGTKDFALYDSNAGAGTRIIVTASGNVGIGTSSPNAAALVDVASTTKGFLPPRMTTAQRDAISTPPSGLMIYNTSTNVLNFYNGSAWGAV